MKQNKALIILVVALLVVSIAILYVDKQRKSEYDQNTTLSTQPMPVTQPLDAVPSEPAVMSNSYKNTDNKFTLMYPIGYTIDDTYVYSALGPGKEINGVKFIIPVQLAQGTNLSTDTYFSVEHMPVKSGTACTANLFLGTPISAATNIVDSGTSYSFAKQSDAGAGNRYDETVYAISGTNPCIALRYFIHYGVIENYPPDTVTEFNRNDLIVQFDSIRNTVQLIQ